MIKIGCCGFCVKQEKYFQTFNVIEIQYSFYRELGIRQVNNWKKMAPAGFEFILKVPQCITHNSTSPTYRRSDIPEEKRKYCGEFRLNEITEAIMEKFFERAKILSATKFLFQTPASFKPTDKNIKNMINFFTYFKGRGIFLWEVRGKWDNTTVLNLCKKLNLIHATDPFIERPQLYGDFTYYRMHGSIKTQRYSYKEEEIEKIISLSSKNGYIMFNNVYMFENALRAREILEKSVL